MCRQFNSDRRHDDPARRRGFFIFWSECPPEVPMEKLTRKLAASRALDPDGVLSLPLDRKSVV